MVDRIRNAIIDLQLRHKGNSAAEVVTVSIGAAAVNRGESITDQDLWPVPIVVFIRPNNAAATVSLRPMWKFLRFSLNRQATTARRSKQ